MYFIIFSVVEKFTDFNAMIIIFFQIGAKWMRYRQKYSLVALNSIKDHEECIKTRHFQIKNKYKKILGRGIRPRIAGETRLLSWTTLSTA